MNKQFSKSVRGNDWTEMTSQETRTLSSAGRRSSTKESSFRNNRVICDVCDKDPPLGTRLLPEVTKAQQSAGYINNTYWRRHDPHHWTQQPHIEADARVHLHNWFTEEQDLVRGEQKRVDRVKRRDEYQRYVKEHPHGLDDYEYRKELSQAEKQLKIQQKKCSWNNPLGAFDNRMICPMPSKPPSTSANIDPDKLINQFSEESSKVTRSKGITKSIPPPPSLDRTKSWPRIVAGMKEGRKSWTFIVDQAQQKDRQTRLTEIAKRAKELTLGQLHPGAEDSRGSKSNMKDVVSRPTSYHAAPKSSSYHGESMPTSYHTTPRRSSYHGVPVSRRTSMKRNSMS